jgi:hypothetical protein
MIKNECHNFAANKAFLLEKRVDMPPFPCYNNKIRTSFNVIMTGG